MYLLSRETCLKLWAHLNCVENYSFKKLAPGVTKVAAHKSVEFRSLLRFPTTL